MFLQEVLINVQIMSCIDDKGFQHNPNYSDGMALDAEKNFNRLCIDCHGSGGLGDGPESLAVDLPTPNFTASNFWKFYTRIKNPFSCN